MNTPCALHEDPMVAELLERLATSRTISAVADVRQRLGRTKGILDTDRALVAAAADERDREIAEFYLGRKWS